MKREYAAWLSPALGRTMEMLVFGHAGARVLVFPTSCGRFFEWEDRGMPWVIGDAIENGWLQLYCVDSVDAESWYCYWAEPAGRVQRHMAYDAYLRDEVLPFSQERNANPYLMTLGASFGGYHAMNFGLRYPDRVNRVIALSGLFDIRRFCSGYYSDAIYFNNPVDFAGNEQDPGRLNALRRQNIIIATGRDDPLLASARELSGKLWGQGVGNALREWDGWAHDWPYWQKMLALYINGND